jgi:hypothetical protein
MKNLLAFALLILTLVLLSNCGNKKNPTESQPQDKEGAQTTVELANQALEDVLYVLVNRDDIQHPSDIDFAKPYSLYNDAYQKDPNNLDANFGLALTNILMLTQDQELQKVWDDWDKYLQEYNPFEAPVSGSSASHLHVGFPTSIRYFNIPGATLAKAIIGTQKMALVDAPKLSSIQIILESKLLPKLNLASQALERVDDNQSYRFIVTPRMLGDPDEDQLEIDLTEIYALEVSVNVLRAMVGIAVAYNVDFVSYDSVGIYEAFRLGSSFMTLRNNGAYLGQAKTSLLTAIDKLESGINFLRNERDSQSDDIIKIGSDDVDNADLDTIMAHINDARNVLTRNHTLTQDWDFNESTPDRALTINVGNFFDNPIADFKAKLPPYIVKVARDTIDYSYRFESGNSPVSTSVLVNQAGFYFYRRTYYWYEYGGEFPSYSSNIAIPRYDQEFERLKQTLRATPGISYLYLALDWSRSFNASGSYNISDQIDYNRETRKPELAVYVPEITWQANSFAQWIFPDPTFNGILPGLTDGQFKQTFGITAADWKKTFRLDLDGGF